MEIERITPPAFDSLSQEEVEQMLALDPQVDPEAVALMMASATEIVERQTGITIAHSRWRITYGPEEIGSTLAIPFSPLISVDTMTVYDASGTVSQLSGFTIVPSYRKRVIVPDFSAITTSPIALTIEVTAGYEDPSLVPASLLHAVAIVMSAGYDNRQSIDPATMLTVERLCAPWRRIW